ncbi:MAG: ROK family glucokinase [Thermoflavifilum sp.]|nr:ROK family glucokinase [Thermoflavifilum sp.]MCL6514412.1 ROK family glucokinase [Alicyclobacillus sp.]
MASYSIGIDLGGTKIAAGIVADDGQLLHETSVPTPKTGRDDILGAIWRLVAELTRLAEERGWTPLIGIGVGTAGQVDFATGTVLRGTSNIEDWDDVPVRAWLGQHTDLPVWVDNDVNVLALAEKHLGAGRDADDVICLALGTGVGGGAIVGGHLLHGAFGGAAEFGHITVDMRGPVCKCGFRGCLELYASGTGIARLMREALAVPELADHPGRQAADLSRVSSRDVFAWYKAGDPVAHRVMADVFDALAAGVVSLIHTFNPRVVVLGGGVMRDGAWIRDAVEERVRRWGIPALVEGVDIRLAALGPEAGLVGAAWQAHVYHGMGAGQATRV